MHSGQGFIDSLIYIDPSDPDRPRLNCNGKNKRKIAQRFTEVIFRSPIFTDVSNKTFLLGDEEEGFFL